MEFVFDEGKAAEAASVLLRAAGGRMPVWQLGALLYLADRQALIDTGYPTTGARFVAGADGPELKQIGELVHATECSGMWGTHVTAALGGQVSCTGVAEEGWLSEYDCELLESIHRRFGSQSAAELQEHLRGLPEWVGHDRNGDGLDPIVILRSDGYTDDDIEDAVEQAEAALGFHKLLGR